VVTPYTSYLIMEDERRVVQENRTQSAAPKAAAKMKGEYDAMRMKAGAPSVQASKEVEALKNARNHVQLKQGAARMEQNNKSKNVQGRAVYQVGDNWIDSHVQSVKNAAVKRIQFASAAYFELLENEPRAAEFLALGKNVRFALKGHVYEIHE
jgi:hypothetical protein